MKSRNQREGKYIAGWCLNPAYAHKNGKIVEKKRAGGNHNLVAYRNVINCGFRIPGVSLVREFRFEGEQQ